MGISSSSNTIDSMVNNTTTVINTYQNLCSNSTSTTNEQFIANDCHFNNTPINIMTTQIINQNCIQNATTTNNIQSSIEQSMQQSAKAITQQFSFPSAAIANNFIKESVKLGTDIANHYSSVCLNEGFNAKVGFSCNNSTFTNSAVTIDSFQSITQDCISNFLTNNSTISDLKNMLAQTSSATQENTFAFFIIVFAVLIGIFAYAGISIADNPLVEWGIVILVVISLISTALYTASAKQNGNYPYKKA